MPDIADIRLANTLALFDEFVRSTVVGRTGQELKGLEARFAERLQIAPSYWSQLKSRNRQIGETLARQFEAHFQRPHGWLDESHDAAVRSPSPAGAENDDERFLVQMLLTCYRMNPSGVKQRMLELMEGELAKVCVATGFATRREKKAEKTPRQ
ncbi:MAG: hypothetical protein ACREBN_10095 [Burkholderiaceae bacterium]